jgi:hypothetical protein
MVDEAKPEPKGRARLLKWLEADDHSLTWLAKQCGVSVPSAHGWTGRHRPAEEHRPILCSIIGGKPGDWDVTKEERAARAGREKRLKSLSGKAA